MQSETLSTGLPTINIGPGQTPANHVYSITNSLSSAVNGTYSTAPLATTGFQTGMLTPVDLKTIASLATYYPREVVFYALIDSIDVKMEKPPYLSARLLNDPSQAYFDADRPYDLDRTPCYNVIYDSGYVETIFTKVKAPEKHDRRCSYWKFVNLLSLFMNYGLDTELVQVPTQLPAQAQANQAAPNNIVTVARLCRNQFLTPPGLAIINTNLPLCGLDKRQDAGGTIQATKTETTKTDDEKLQIATKSLLETTTTTKNFTLPITSRYIRVEFTGIGWVDLTINLRSPDGFLSYLGSWYKVGGQIPFRSLRYPDKPIYQMFAARQILVDGPYLSIAALSGPSLSCYTSMVYEGQAYCVPMEAHHTSMLMDIAVILRNLNITPQDLNAPVSVRVID